MNYKTSIADNVTEKEISEKLGISLSTVKRSVERLKKNKNLIDKVISNNVIAEGSYKTYNKYHVAKCNENFFYIYNSFFNDDMNIAKASERTKLKNFLLKLKAICKKETNKYIRFFVTFGAVHVLKLVNLLPNKVMLVLLNMCLLIALILFP
ncbi:winged helix-turn-helix transcriptional regulator, partial [uncultured Bacteroides sp.]